MKFLILTAEPDNWVTESFVKEAEKSDYQVRIINPSDCFLSMDNEPFIAVDGVKLSAADVLIPRLSEDNLDYKVAIIKHIEKMETFVLNSGESMALCSDKVKSQLLMNANGIVTPKSALVSSSDQLSHVVEYFDNKFPIILKTITGTHGIGVMKIDSEASLTSVAQTLLKENIRFMVQEFIEHKQSLRIVWLGDKVLAANVRGQPENSKDFRTNAHLGSETKTYEPSEKEIELASKLSEMFGCRFCAIDYIKQDDGTLLVLEVNGSPGLEGIQKDHPDQNLPKMVIDYCASQAKGEDKLDLEKSVPVEAVPLEVHPDNILSDITHVKILGIDGDKEQQARVDTGAKISSIGGEDIKVTDNSVIFTFSGKQYRAGIHRMIKILNPNNEESERRPVVLLNIELNGVTFANVEFNIADRSHMKYAVLLGRTFLEQSGHLVAINKPSNVTSEEE